MNPATVWIKPPGPATAGLRIGLLGGSFNPAHAGHLHVSEVALKRLELDYVWWLVSPQNPLKSTASMAPLRQRLASARAIAGRRPRLCISDIESRMGTRYTIDTVTQLKTRFSQLRFVWLMGTDNLLTFHRWQNWRRLAQIIPIAVVTRPGTIMAPLMAVARRRFAGSGTPRSERLIVAARPPALVVLDGKRSQASATALRHRGLGWPSQPVLQ